MRSRMLVPVLGLLLGLLLAGLAAPAYADAGPAIDRPVGTTPEYQGFDGPYDVDFSNAATGTYSCTVEQGGTVVATCDDTFAWTGVGVSQHAFRTPVLPAGSYTFRLRQDPFETPDSTVDFTVRGYARPTCSVRVPGAVRVNSGEEIVTGVLGADCAAAHVTYASWEVDHATAGLRNLMTFDHRTRDTFSLFAADPLGTYLITPTQAINAAGDDILQSTPRIQVRLDSRLKLRSHRTGRRVTLTATLTRYARGENRFAAWSKQPVTFSARSCSSCAWHRVAVRRTDKHGRAVLRVRAAHVKGYRVTAGGAPLVWAPYAKRTRR